MSNLVCVYVSHQRVISKVEVCFSLRKSIVDGEVNERNVIAVERVIEICALSSISEPLRWLVHDRHTLDSLKADVIEKWKTTVG